MENTKYVAYLRVSTKAQGDSGLGLEAQKDIISHYTKDGIVISEFLEVESGKAVENRPILRQAISEAKKQNAILVIAKLDRLSRDVKDVFSIREGMKGNLMSCDIPSMDSLTWSIFAGLAQRERELISIRTKAALKAKKEQGAKLGNPNKDSLLKAGAKGRAKSIENRKMKASENINTLHASDFATKLRESGNTYDQIAHELNARHYKTPNGNSFSKAMVWQLLNK
jgi:DNA invertase Pin-like site-specific DNA recombinase